MNINYTMLKAYKSCHRKCYLQYVKRVIASEQVDHRPFFVGICADWLFQKWVDRHYEQDWMYHKANEIFDWFATKRRIRFKGKDDRSNMKKKLQRSVADLQTCSFDSGLPERRFDTQKVVKFDREGVSFYGKLDMWFPDEALVWDLKITEATKYLDIFQLHMFSWLLENEPGSCIKVKSVAFLAPLMRPYLRQSDWTDVDRHTLETELFALINMIKEESGWDKTSKDCWGCPVQTWCELMDDGTLECSVEAEKTKAGTLRIALNERSSRELKRLL